MNAHVVPMLLSLDGNEDPSTFVIRPKLLPWFAGYVKVEERMDDAEVTRQAIAISIASWAELEVLARRARSDGEVLAAYVKLCPHLPASSPAFKATIEVLERAPKGKRTILSVAHPKAAKPTLEATRVAARITISALSRLMVQSETLNDFEVMQRYIEQCPFVNADSKTTLFVLEGLNEASSVHLPPLDGVETDSGSENSVDKAKTEGDKPTKKEDNSINNTEKEMKTPKVTKSTGTLKRFLVRTILLDFPMTSLFFVYLGLCWIRRVEQLYIHPSLKAAVWTKDRAVEEITYYNRFCTPEDMSTHNADDLLVPENATIQEAYEHQLLHGFSIFQGVLTDDVMHDLRTYVDSRNRKLSAEESIFVIAGKNRFSFGLGTEEPCVARAVTQVATHPMLAPALEKVLGKNPAVIEMTAITSSYGAVNQHFHDDVVARASVLKYGRSFGPSYSVFIQLQNTTKAMGATAICPGLHKCPDGDRFVFCEEEGFQAVNSETGYWKAGDALLMNMNSFHRGAAHTDPNALDRVMFILTFVPKPEAKAESRQLSQGITFSLRWDMWGHTLYDLKMPDTRMTQPWATLRSLGLYKPKDADWGIDYVSGYTMRMVRIDIRSVGLYFLHMVKFFPFPVV